MIRLFTALCKALLEITASDEQLFNDATKTFCYHDAKCPNCGASGKLVPHGRYTRDLLSFEGGSPLDQYVEPLRFKCRSCKSSHSLLPDILVPYSRYSLRFKLNVLIAYFEREMTVKAICEYFVIAVSTLYEWKKRLLVHKDLMLGVLISLKKDALGFLRALLGSFPLSGCLRDFFRRYAFSFLQHQSASAARSRPP